MNGQTGTTASKAQRRWDIDWLRVLAVLLLFFYHPARIFYTYGGWYIQNWEKSKALSNIALFMEHWHMPLLFMLAGISTWFALDFRSGGQYVKERFIRLLVPLVFGLLVIVPPQIYFELLHRGRVEASFASYIDFYPHFFDGRYTGDFDMGHLWFIAYLFGFSLLMLPLFLFFKRDTGQRVMGRLAGFLSLPGMIFLLAVPVMVANYLMLDFYPNPIYFLTFFGLGYVLVADGRFYETIARHKGIALVLGVGLFVVWLSFVTRDVISSTWMQPIPRDLIAWFCLIAILGYGKKLLGFTNGFLRYANEASYPVYILHQTVIVIIAYYVVRWNAGALVKFAIIAVASLAVTVALYDVVVKRTNVTRFLFGMRLKKKPEKEPAPRPRVA